MEMFLPAVILWEVLTCELEGRGGEHLMQNSFSVAATNILCESYFLYYSYLGTWTLEDKQRSVLLCAR